MELIRSFFLNSSVDHAPHVVNAPAFSLTKVMATVAPLITLVVALMTNLVRDKADEFSMGQLTTLIVSLIAFLAVTGSADVLARSIATSAEVRVSGGTRLLQLGDPLEATVVEAGGERTAVVLLAVSPGPAHEFLVRTDEGRLRWEPQDKLRIVSTPLPRP